MAQARNILALDLGAESGRGILGRFDGERVQLEVLHRFPNGPVKVGNRLHWDPLRLFAEMKTALGLAVKHGPVASLGVDTWGVDYAFLGEWDELLGNPRHYRDPHTEPVMSGALAVPQSSATIFSHTGIQFLRFNTLFQLLAQKQAGATPYTAARKLLFIPDLFHHWFGAETVNEVTITSTSQLYNPHTQDWAWPLIDHYQLPRDLFKKIAPAGTRIGTLHAGIKTELELDYDIAIHAPASHDTAAAVAAVPAEGNEWCYLSSGTWSLMGVELPKPVINEAVRAANFTNEAGVQGTTRFLKNIMGMWLVQECRRSFARHGQEYSYEELVQLAEQSMPWKSLVNPDDARFLLPDDMPQAIASFCRETGQAVPEKPGEFIRCCLESLALRYRWTKEKLTELTGKTISTIHIVGGGSQNRLLNQFTADATRCAVVAGPVEATALGNVLTQAMGLGLISSLDQLRRVVRQSSAVERFSPAVDVSWEEPYQRWLRWLR
jgi:rhamnulokinase